jgi:hypothetical protein
MRLISSLMVCLALSACATDYVSQMSQPNFGVQGLRLSGDTLDPSSLMNGTYAAKQKQGLYVSKPSGSQWSGWDP